jgi:glycerol-3-phosphate dehydrogenase
VSACRDLAEQAGVPRADAGAVAEQTVGLFGSRAAAIWQSGHGSAALGGPAALGGLIRGVGLPRAAVEFCVREEWATSLDDLMERRLMLSFHEQLSRESIADVAESLAAAGVLPSDRVAVAVEGCVTRLEERYGRRVPRASDAPGPAGGTKQGGER